MKKIKVGLVILCLLVVSGIAVANQVYVQGGDGDLPTNPLEGKIIALDAGHGFDGAVGATGYCDTKNETVSEVIVNETVREKLTELLGAEVVFSVPQLETRKERVAAAEEAGADILISIHHNGSLDTNADYTETFITQTRFDKPLADFIHPALVEEIQSVTDPDIADHGITNSGFGMTVFGDHPAVLTEAYFITNTEAACDYLSTEGVRVEAEAQGLFNGISGYFSSVSETSDPQQKNK